MNPFPTNASIKAETVIGTAEILTNPPQNFQACENENEEGNSSSARRLQFSHPQDNLLGNVNTVKAQNSAPTEKTTKSQFSHLSSEKQEDVPPHLQKLFEESSEGRSQRETTVIKKLLYEYQDIFSKHDDDLGLTSLAEHQIDLTDSKPIKQPFRRVPLAFVNEEKQAIDKLLKQGVIRPSNSPWASPLCLVRKKDGSVRPCVDYRRLNKVTRPDAFPVPKVDECIDAISGSKLFSTVDLTCGYLQVPVREQDVSKTAFVSRHGLYEFTSTPFGMINSGATFQRVMELAMKGLNWQICIIYIDDCIIFSSTFDDHIERLRLVFQRFRMASLKLKPKKCELLRSSVTFLGFKITDKGACPDPNNVAKVSQWPVPANVTEVKQFLGLCAYYRKHVKQFSIIAKPLFDLTKKDSKLVWNKNCQHAFDSLKTALTSNQVMALPTSDAEGLIVDVDACNYGIGCVLSQVQNGEERVIAYASRSLNRAERNYCVTDRELLAIKYFVEYFRHYLLMRHFTVRSDHLPLKILFSMKNPSGRIARWIEILSGFDFEVQYRKGFRHQNADSMSRCPNPKDCSCSDIDSEETLKCGPRKKCLKRAEQMESTLLKDEGCTSEQEKLISPQVSRCSDQCYTSGNVTRSIMCFLASAIKHAVLVLMILTFLFFCNWRWRCTVTPTGFLLWYLFRLSCYGQEQKIIDAYSWCCTHILHLCTPAHRGRVNRNS